MAAKHTVAILSLLCGLSVAHVIVNQDDQPPKFSQIYTVSGNLELPYAEIVEPFQAYYDGTNNRSRIDYYAGLVRNFLRGDVGTYGTSYKVAYMTNYQVTNKLSCFGLNGTKGSPVKPQSLFPDTTNMKLAGTMKYKGKDCKKWQQVTVEGKKTNTYTLLVDQNGDPVMYEMMGFDSLIGSHYDKYILEYWDYSATSAIEPGVFDISNMTCSGFPGPGEEHRITFNPMQEFVHGVDSHNVALFQTFKKQHNKAYEHELEHANREHTFRQNVRYINSKNRAGLTYRMAINHLTDKTNQELKLMNGFRRTKNYDGIQGLSFHKEDIPNAPLPEEKDWRLYGAVAQVKDQAVCGSCWSFGTTGTIEGAYFLKTGNLVRLSQQQLMDCSWGEGNNGCDGGEDFRSYNWIMKKGGLTSEAQYGQYLGADGKCHSDQVKPVVQLSGYVNVTPYDEDALKKAIAFKGPVSVAIDASHKSLSFYANGVYYEPACGSKPEDLDHAVLAVGYGVMNGEGYWLVKNSWSTYWGNDGYVLMSQKNNNCGVATSPTYPLVK